MAANFLMNGPMRRLFAAFIAALLPCIAAACEHVSRRQQVPVALLQRAFDEARIATGTPGASAAIIEDGRVLWIGQGGVTDMRTKQPVKPDTLFSLASVTKPFVVALVVRLSEERKLRLDESIASFFPAYLPDKRRVTVFELLGHTSGYREDEDDPVILKHLADPNYTWSRDDIERPEGPVRFQPGSRFKYCNSCYVMLGSVIERAAGSSVGAAFHRLIVIPLNLTQDVDFVRLPDYAPRISRGYDAQRGKLVDTFAGARSLGVPTSVWGEIWTDGGIVATAEGVARFTDALFSGRAISRSSLALMLDPGPTHPHAQVLEELHHDGRVWRGHSGFYYGFTAESWYDASRRLTITVLANRTDASYPAMRIWRSLASAYDRSG